MDETAVSDVIVRITPHAGQADAWAFVLEALVIPHAIVPVDTRWAIAVPASHAARAAAALDDDDREAVEAGVPEPALPDHGRPIAPLATALALGAFFYVTGPREGGTAWFRAGSAVAERILSGEWWRALTALTLHADVAHVAGNGVALLIFGSAACRWVGSGVAMTAILLAGTAGNLLTAWAYGSAHNSVGASTATFGALGVLGGLQIFRRLRDHRPVDRRRRILAAGAACLGLFAMLGVGEKSDVVAHLTGLAAGLVAGLALGFVGPPRVGRLGQAALILVSVAATVGAWLLALGPTAGTLLAPR